MDEDGRWCRGGEGREGELLYHTINGRWQLAVVVSGGVAVWQRGEVAVEDKGEVA